MAAHCNGGHKLVGEGAPDGIEVDDVSADADARHTQDKDLLAEVFLSS